HLVQKPMITISRQFGAQGGEIGRVLAEELGIGFYSQELVHEVAKRTDVRQQVVHALDERVQKGFGAFIDNMMVLRHFTQDDYVRHLSETIVALGRHRPGVIVGRGGHLILDANKTLRVRAYAPLEHRVKVEAERNKLTDLEAREKVQRVDQERKVFYEKHFGEGALSIHHFDLLLNTAQMSVSECATTIAHLYRRRFGIG
ncbi:MAG TPA: cytidylate kinase-like family protein, partial [Polyangiaceae bacterium]|nr:cytidylate kinase-like family protein [Polyangiaceae bacterium]